MLSEKSKQTSGISKVSKQTNQINKLNQGEQTTDSNNQDSRMIGNISSELKKTIDDINLKYLENMQRRKMTEIVHLGDTSVQGSIEENKQRNPTREENLQTQRHKRNMKKALGKNEEINEGFEEIRPKAWMYIYRVQNKITEGDILNYLHSKPNEEITFEGLQAKGGNKCFIMAADIKYKDSFYSSDF